MHFNQNYTSGQDVVHLRFRSVLTKTERRNTTDWNRRENAEKWRAAWASYANRALEAAGRPERIDHRSYKRQGIDKIPSVHMGPAASQMERRGITTVKGNINREIAADNKLLKEIKARITRLYNWSREQSGQSEGKASIRDFLFQTQRDTTAASNYAKVKALKENVAVFNFLQANGITSMQELFDKITAMNSDYYAIRGEIVGKERRIAALNEQLEMWAQYQKYKPIRQKLDKVAPEKREQIERLSEYIASTGKTYKSHAATIRRWISDDRRKGKSGLADYSCKEGESL